MNQLAREILVKDVSPLRAIDEGAARIAQLSLCLINKAIRGLRNILFLSTRPPTQANRIVVHLVGNIGDIVVAIPALSALRNKFKDAKILLVSSGGNVALPGASDILQGSTLVDSILQYIDKDVRSLANQRRLLNKVRAFRPDLVVMMTHSRLRTFGVLRNLVFARLSGAQFAVGLERASVSFGLAAQSARRHVHEVDRYLGLLRELKVQNSPIDFPLQRPRSEEEARIAALNVPIAVMCPGGKQVAHRWPKENFAAIGRMLASRGLNVVLVGSAEDASLCSAIVREIGTGQSLAGELTLAGTNWLLRRASIMVSNDTGPMHLAATSNTPTVAIFGSGDFRGRWYPFSSACTAIRYQSYCPKCLFAKKITDHCVRKIPIGVVQAACENLLESVAAREECSIKPCVH